MTRRGRTVLALVAVALAVGPTSVALAVPPTKPAIDLEVSQRTVSPPITGAAWFQPDPLCSTPLGCGFIPLPALSPYPKGTFHIGTALGRQTARAFIGVTLSKAAQTARGGTLSIPLDTEAADGSVAPGTAAINVCVIYQTPAAVEGGFAGAPSPNCLPAAHARYVAKPQPHLVANLDRLGGKLDGVKGFALLPADADPTSAWHVVFKLPNGNVAASQRPSLTLLIGQPPMRARPPAEHRSSPGRSTGGSGVVGVPDLAQPDPRTSTTIEPVNPAPVVATRRGHYVRIGYQYPQIWLLPLVLIVLVPFTIRAMTKDLTRR